MGDVNKEKAIFAEVFKLLGNSSYGKMIEALERHQLQLHKRRKNCGRCIMVSMVRGPH